MSKAEKFEMEGKVLEKLPNAMFHTLSPRHPDNQNIQGIQVPTMIHFRPLKSFGLLIPDEPLILT